MAKLKLKVSNNESFRKLLLFFGTEFCATAMLLSLICASSVSTFTFPSSQLAMSISCGCSVGVVIQCFGFITQAHINPAVSIASFMMGYISLVTLIVYIVAQIFGSVLGYAIFLGMAPDDALDDRSCLCLIHPSCSNWKAFLVEFVLTSVLIYVCLAVWDDKNVKWGESNAIKFAILITMVCLTGGNYTGASINPARSFAPALFHLNFDRLWIYILAQVLAAIICPITWIYFFTMKVENAREESD